MHRANVYDTLTKLKERNLVYLSNKDGKQMFVALSTDLIVSEEKDRLENRKSGTKEIKIDPGFEKLVLGMWKKKKRSVYMMRKDLRNGLKRNGYNISERQIRKIYKKQGL